MHAPDRPEWRDEGDYRWLLDSDATLHAWEWLRRRDDYCRAAAQGLEGGSRKFGLIRFADPARAGPHARPWWHSDADPAILQARLIPSEDRDHSQLIDSPHVDIAISGADQHLLVHDGRRQLRLDIIGGTVSQGTATLEWRIRGLGQARPAIEALDRLLGFVERHNLRPATHPSHALAKRWTMLLRVRDAIDAGATQQAIASTLFGAALMGPRWRVDSASIRSRVQRLVSGARSLARRDPIEMLIPVKKRINKGRRH